MIDFNNFDIDVLVLYIVISIFREVPVGTFALVGSPTAVKVDCCGVVPPTPDTTLCSGLL